MERIQLFQLLVSLTGVKKSAIKFVWISFYMNPGKEIEQKVVSVSCVISVVGLLSVILSSCCGKSIYICGLRLEKKVQ